MRRNDRPAPVIVPRSVQGRILPHDLEAEAACVSAILSGDPGALENVIAVAKPSDFYSEANRRIIEAATSIASRADALAVDVVTVAGELRATGKLEEIGGVAYLNAIADATPSTSNARYHAAIVRDRARTRRIIAAAQLVAAEGYDAGSSAALESQARTLLDEAAGPADRDDLVSHAYLTAPVAGPAFAVPDLAIAPGAPALVAGYGYSGKTVFAQALALSSLTGTRVLGIEAKRGPVLHVDFEQGAYLCTERYQRLSRAAGVDWADAALRLRLAAFPSLYLDDLASEPRLAQLATGCVLGIVDSLKASTPSLDENNSEIRKALDMLGRVSERTGCAFIVIHHARKSPADKSQAPDPREIVRGSSGIFDACATVYVFSAKKGEPVRIEHVKDRWRGNLRETTAFTVADVPDTTPDGVVDERWGLKLVSTTAPDDSPALRTISDDAWDDLVSGVLRVLERRPRSGLARIRESVRGRRESVAEILRELETQGRVTSEADPRDGRRMLYSLAETVRRPYGESGREP